MLPQMLPPGTPPGALDFDHFFEVWADWGDRFGGRKNDSKSTPQGLPGGEGGVGQKGGPGGSPGRGFLAPQMEARPPPPPTYFLWEISKGQRCAGEDFGYRAVPWAPAGGPKWERKNVQKRRSWGAILGSKCLPKGPQNSSLKSRSGRIRQILRCTVLGLKLRYDFDVILEVKLESS